MKNLGWFFYFFLLAYHINGQSLKYEEKLNSLFEKGNKHFYNNKDSAYYYYNEIKELATAEKDWKTVIDALATMNIVADLNSDLELYQKNLLVLDSLYAVQKPYIDSLPESVAYRNLLLNSKGTYHYLLNDYKPSREAFHKIVEVTEQLQDSLLTVDVKYYLSLSYSYLAKMYVDENKFDLAKQYYTKNIRYLIAENATNNQSLLFKNYSLLAEVYKNEGKFDEANKYLLKTLDFNLQNKNDASVLTILNIVQNHNSLKQKDSAAYYLKIAQNLLVNHDPELSSYYQVSAETYQKENNYIEAEKEFNKALELIQKEWDHKKNWEIAHVLNKIGLLQKQFGYFNKAITTFDSAMDQLALSNSAINQATLLKILRNKAEALNSLQRTVAYPSTITTVNRGVEILDVLKPTFKSNADKLFLIEDVFPLFESGMEAAYNLFQSSKEKKYIEQAFQYSEKSKAVLLMEALLGAKATEFANIPSELLGQENQLKTKITFTEKQLNNTKDDTAALEDDLFDLREEHRQLVKKIETDYKTYYDLKYNNKTITIAETQNLLANDEQLISYFYGNDAIYAISIDKNYQQMERINIDVSLETDIKKMHELLRDPQSDINVLSKLSFGLYTKLLAPFLKSHDHKKLVIIADGLLNYIPFAALNTRLGGMAYLTESFSISYANSTTLLSQLRQRQPKNANILAFAPSFSGQIKLDVNQVQLLPLPNNKREVEEILTSFHGRSFVDDDASLQNFKVELGNFGIIHLATHAIFDDTSPDDSYLAFAQKQNGDNLLYVRDLYNLRTDADMVTLSACESGVGELRRGEGFLSLARGFFYSGASSICSTLWKINDASSTQLMDSFYKNLAEGDAKDRALQKAQVQFLNANQQNTLAHPYYWSGFVLSGNTEAVVQSHIWLWMVLGGLILLVLGFVFFRKRKKDGMN